MLVACTDAPKKQASPAANGNGAAMAGKKRALEQGSGDSASSSGDDEDASEAPAKRAQSASQARKKRRNVLPAIRRDQRCGHCRTCLNPQVSDRSPGNHDHVACHRKRKQFV